MSAVGGRYQATTADTNACMCLCVCNREPYIVVTRCIKESVMKICYSYPKFKLTQS
jgi:hypothetical protein